MKKIYKITLIITLFLCTFSFFSSKVSTPVSANTSAKSMCTIEATTGRVLYAKNKDIKLANASTTKIATFLTVLKNCTDFNKVVNIDNRAIGIAGTSIYLKKGEKLTVKELLYGMMLVSGNDAATALALMISESVSKFAELMTQTAHSVGAINTTFKNPHGLDEKGHLTTAYDLALIASECYKYDIFKEIVTTKNTKITGSTENSYRYLKNKNKLLSSLDGCVGVKTGFTDDAGRCLVSSALRNNMQVVCVVLNCGPMFEESAALIEKSYSEFAMEKILEPYNFSRKIPVMNSKITEVRTYTRKSFSYPLKTNELDQITIETTVNDFITAPLAKESEVGEIKIYLNNNLLFSEKIYTMEEVESIKVHSKLKDIISQW